jgi:hypothetical protein
MDEQRRNVINDLERRDELEISKLLGICVQIV